MYFAAITSSPECQGNDVDFTHLAGDLQNRGHHTEPVLHHAPTCATTGTTARALTGSRAASNRADAWLQQHVPEIMDSPAFKQDGMLVITFDEAEGKESAAC